MKKYDDNVLHRVRAEWIAFKDRTGMTQEEGAALIGIRPATFSQYLRGHNELNTDFILSFARLVGVQPHALCEKLDLTFYEPRISYTAFNADESCD